MHVRRVRVPPPLEKKGCPSAGEKGAVSLSRRKGGMGRGVSLNICAIFYVKGTAFGNCQRPAPRSKIKQIVVSMGMLDHISVHPSSQFGF